MYEGRPESFGYPYRFDPQADAIAKDLPSILRHVAGRFRAEPLRYLRWYLVGKPYYFLGWDHVQGWDVLVYPVRHSPFYENALFVHIRAAHRLVHWPLMLLGLAGGLLAWRRTPSGSERPGEQVAVRCVSIVVAYGLLVHVIVAPFPRYAIPFWPLIYALAVYTLALAAHWIASRRSLDRT
jgi:hypothetical protein